MRNTKGKVIRDSVHGDIFIEEKYMQLVDTKEFQRLRRIKQLSVGNMVFPCAEHTRFSHSLGTFYIMTLIINHFDKIFRRVGLEKIETEDRDIALAAALLHDIGHCAFSHAFENVWKSQGQASMTHEAMSVNIITMQGTSIHTALVDNFGDAFPQKVADIISKKSQYREKFFKNETEKPDLQFVLSSLVSSQLDADRMDYLVRDAQFTGVKFGNIDIERIILAMSLGINSEKKFCVCILDKYLPNIESYLIARYQMHKGVYFHDFKCEMEMIIDKILLRGKQLFLERKLSDYKIPDAVKKIFKNQELSIEEYCSLDDSIFNALFSEWKADEDIELSFLCDSFLLRNKFQQLPFREKDGKELEDFKEELRKILKNYNLFTDLEKVSFYLELSDDIKMYKVKRDNIYVTDKYNILNDISEVSTLIPKNELKEDRRFSFISTEMIGKLCGEKVKEDVKALIQKYENSSCVEIEAKYLIKDKKEMGKVCDAIKNINGYDIEQKKQKKQVDYYYDTEFKLLQESNKTLRIREKEDSFTATIKLPLLLQGKDSSHTERQEYEEAVEQKDIGLLNAMIKRRLPEVDLPEENLRETLVVTNERTTYNISMSFSLAS